MTQTQALARTKTPLQAYGVLAAGVFAVSTGSIFIRLAQSEDVPSLLVAAARLIIASLILTPFVLRRYIPDLRRLSRRDLTFAGVAGFFLAIHFITWVSSLEYTSVLISAVLVNTHPFWVALLEVLFLKARLVQAVIVGLILAFIGGVLIALPSGGDTLIGQDALKGALLALCGALAVAVYFVIGRKLRAQLPVLPYIWMVYSFAAVILAAGVLLAKIPVSGYSASGYVWLVMLALVPQLIGHSSLNYALGYLPATFISLSIQLEPIVSAVLAFFLFAEIPRLPQMIGSAVILAGIVVASLGQARTD